MYYLRICFILENFTEERTGHLEMFFLLLIFRVSFGAFKSSGTI